MARINILILFIQGIVLCYSTCPDTTTWSYEGPNGPESWSKTYPLCSEGQQQSPVNIDTQKVVLDSHLKPLKLKNYDIPLRRSQIANDGHTITITPEDKNDRYIVLEGEKFSLIQIHFHWGTSSSDGSEHAIDGKKTAMEVHFLHQNGEKKATVVGVLYQEVAQDNAKLKPIIKALGKVPYKGDTKTYKVTINLLDLIDDGSAYYRYSGSRATPSCEENIVWTILKQPKSIGAEQIKQFRNLCSSTAENCNGQDCNLSGNLRPVQPLNGRVIYESN